MNLVRTIEAKGVRPDAMRAAVLRNSGLMTGTERDFNLLHDTVLAAGRLLKEDELEQELRQQFGMERLKQDKRPTRSMPAKLPRSS